jgi:NAD(P)-dependent dehydrogenase (short-subunit alcohol dehydrogenase family)
VTSAPLESLLNLRGSVAAVAGGAGAIGSAIARRLAECGADVYCLDLPDRPLPAGVQSIACDITDGTACLGAVDRIDRDRGRLDILVHAAGVIRDARIWKATPADWDLVIATNLTSAFHLVRGSIPIMRRRGSGSIVLISSINGERAKVGQAAYAASKAGLNALARTTAREVGSFGIRVNAIAPGWIDTPMTATVPADARERALSESALGRLGDPDDIARATVFLASGMASHVTGQILRVDGGQLIG